MLSDHILYLKEWYKPDGKPKALPDLTTNNKHFLRFAGLLKKKGIKNYLFCLALRDQGLKGIDPHSLNNDNDPDFKMRLRVLREASRNIWYYLRECVKFPGANGLDHMRFNRANCAMVWCFMQGIDYIAIQPRQSGKTTMALILSDWCTYLGCNNFGMGMYCSGDSLRKKNLEALRTIRDNLPKYFVMDNKSGTDNSEMINYARLKNKYWTFIAQKSEVAANNVGRGFAIMALHADEPAFCANIKVSMPVMRAAMTTAADAAKKFGFPHSLLYTTTAGDPSTPSGEEAFIYVNRAFKMTEKLYDFEDRESVRAFLKANSINGAVNGTFSHLQIGMSNEKLIDEIKQKNYSYDTVMRDFLNRWYVGAGTPILPQTVIKRISASRAKDGPLYLEMLDDFVINWYIPEDEVRKFKNKSIIVGLDASEMVDRDFTTAVGIDPTTLKTLFTFRCNSANITAVARFCASMMIKYTKMILVPEAKSSGRAITDAITENLVARGISPFTRIYNKIVQEYDTNSTFKKMDIRDVDLYNNGGRKHVGFQTSGKSREVLYKNVLQKAASISADHIADGTLIDELTSLEVRNGRIDHSTGKHDDMVISWLLAHWLVFYGSNLRFYGLDISQIDNVATESNASKADIDREIKLRELYNETKQKMEVQVDPYLKASFAQQLRVLQSKMSGDIKLAPIAQEVSRRGGYELSSGKEYANDNTRDLGSAILKRIYGQ